MSNSPLVSYTKLSPNHSGKRTHAIDRISPHCVVGQLTAEGICGCFADKSRQASCNYGIGKDGKVALCVDEGNRSWCTSSNANDQRAVTIEVASGTKEPYEITDAAYESLIALMADICKRNGKTKLLWFADKNKSLSYEPKQNEMVITVHRWFANKSCPGAYIYERLGKIADEVNRRLSGGASAQASGSSASGNATGRYRVNVDSLNIRYAPSTDSRVTGRITDHGIYTITECEGSWGRLKSGAGWINCSDAYCTRVGDADADIDSDGQKYPIQVQVASKDLNIRSGPGISYVTRGHIQPGVYNIMEAVTADGHSWGRLKSGAGWIAMEYVKIIG